MWPSIYSTVAINFKCTKMRYFSGWFYVFNFHSLLLVTSMDHLQLLFFQSIGPKLGDWLVHHFIFFLAQGIFIIWWKYEAVASHVYIYIWYWCRFIYVSDIRTNLFLMSNIYDSWRMVNLLCLHTYSIPVEYEKCCCVCDFVICKNRNRCVIYNTCNE